MKRLDYTYALVKALCDESEDYVDCFCPFAMMTFSNKEILDDENIRNRMEEEFNLKAPLHVLGIILNKAKSKGYIEQQRNLSKYKITQDGLNYLDTLETNKEVERRINALIEDLRQFLNDKQISINSEQIHDILISFLKKNIEPLITYINPNVASDSLAINSISNTDKLIIEYILIAEKEKPDIYKTIEDMASGSIISIILNTEDTSELVEIRSRKFKKCTAYLDTNFIFAVLDISSPNLHEPAIELINLMKQNGIEIKAFSFTVDEICRVLKGFIKEGDYYPQSIRVDSIYGGLKSKGWSTTTVKEFIVNIDKTLLKNGIVVEFVRDVNLDKYNPVNNELRSVFTKYKPEQNTFYQNHDIAAFETITEKRRGVVRRIEDSQAFFLTSDSKFSKLNYLEMGHKGNSTVCEIILDRLLTSILWLKNPHAKIPLKSIIAAHSQGMFVRRHVWKRFYEVIREMKASGAVGDENLATLFYHGYVEDMLIGIDATGIDSITSDFVLENIEKASKSKEESVQKQIEGIENDFIERLSIEASMTQQKKDEEWFDRIETIRQNIRASSNESANSRMKWVVISLLFILLLPMFGLLASMQWLIVGIYTGAICVMAIAVQVYLHSTQHNFIRDSYDSRRDRWSRHIYTEKIKEIGLEFSE